jgi:EmrB/QacA subfamily drug resistance transporter
MMIALGVAIVTEAFPATERGRALGITGSIVSVGIVAGPAVGGLIIDLLSWHWIFLVNIPIGIAGIWVAWRTIPDVKPPGGQRFDYWGALALFISLISLLLGMTLGQQLGFRAPVILLLLAAFVVFLALFLAIERRVEQPMIDLALFRNAQFSINLGTGFLIFVAMSGIIILMPFYLENVLGVPIRQVGLLLAVVPIAAGITSPISGSLSDRFGSRRITVSGLAVVVLGLLAVSTLALDTTPLGYALRMLPVGIGLGVFQSPNNSAIMGAAPRERLGVAAGLLSITRTLGQTTGIAILGAIWASRVMGYAGGGDDATLAATADQMAGLHDTLWVTLGLATLALGLGVWGLVMERRHNPLG